MLKSNITLKIILNRHHYKMSEIVESNVGNSWIHILINQICQNPMLNINQMCQNLRIKWKDKIIFIWNRIHSIFFHNLQRGGRRENKKEKEKSYIYQSGG